MSHPVILVAELTIREAARRRIFLAIILLSLLYVALFGLGFGFLIQEVAREEAARPATETAPQAAMLVPPIMTTLGIYGLNLMAGGAALFLGAGTLAGEVASGLMQVVAARPLRRGDIVVGKWLGLLVIATIYMAGTFALLLLVVWVLSGYVPPLPLPAVGLLVLEMALLLAIALLGSALFSTVTNGIVIFMLYGAAWIGGFIEQIGAALRSDLMVNLGIVVSLLMPSDVLWRAASFYLQPSWLLLMQNAAAAGTGLPFAASTPTAPAMLIWAGLYTVAALGGAIAVFSHRDL